MIKINVIVKNKFWMQRIAKPEIYFVKKVNKLNLKNKYFNKKKLEFTLLLSDEKEIKKLNKKFRNKNKATDVLSFPMSHKIILNKKKRLYVGDVIINLDHLKKNKENSNFKESLDKLLIHGFLHLLGKRHETEKNYLQMKKLEDKYFKSIN
jgi:probable rRNA maturation factor